MKFKVGDIIVLMVDREAYYSGYAGNPKVILRAGAIGVVGAVNVPPVTGNGKNFNCVDVVVPGVFPLNNPKNPPKWRAALYNNELRRATKSERELFWEKSDGKTN